MEHYPIKYSEHAASRSTAITTQMRATLIYLAPFLHPCKNVVPGIAQVNEQTAHSPTLTAIQARTSIVVEAQDEGTVKNIQTHVTRNNVINDNGGRNTRRCSMSASNSSCCQNFFYKQHNRQQQQQQQQQEQQQQQSQQKQKQQKQQLQLQSVKEEFYENYEMPALETTTTLFSNVIRKQKQEQKEVQQQTTQAVVVVKAVENIVEIPEDNSTAYYTNRSTKNLRERGHRIIQTHTQLHKQMQTHGLNASILKPFAQPSLQLQRKTPCGRCLAIDNCNNGNMRMDTTESNNNDIFNATSSLLLSRCHCLNNTFSNAEDQLQQLQYLQKQHPNINSTAIIDDENADVDGVTCGLILKNSIYNSRDQNQQMPSHSVTVAQQKQKRQCSNSNNCNNNNNNNNNNSSLTSTNSYTSSSSVSSISIIPSTSSTFFLSSPTPSSLSLSPLSSSSLSSSSSSPSSSSSSTPITYSTHTTLYNSHTTTTLECTRRCFRKNRDINGIELQNPNLAVVAGVSDYVINGIRNALEQEKRNLPSSTLSTSTSTSTSTPTSTSFVSTLPSSSLSVSLLSTLSLLVLGSSSAVKRGLNDRKPAAHLNIWLQRMTVVLGCLHLNKTVSVSKWLLMWLLLTMFSSTAHGWVGRNDVPTNCTFPARWEGSWFLSGYQQSIHIKGSQFSYRGRCAASDGNKYLIVDEKGCHRCLVIYEKHKNVLQYKENFCKGRETLQNLCDQIPGDALLYSLFRESAEPVKCPLKGPFIFTYNRGNGECKSPVSNIESCTEDSRLLLSFQACPDVVGTESTVEELTCLATWKDGNSRYLVGLVSHHHAISNEERYRCFVYEKISSLMDLGHFTGGPSMLSSKDAEYKLAQSGDATCNGLDSAEVGSRIMSLRKPPVTERCDFPMWFKGPRHWHVLMGNAVYNYHSNDGSIHIIKPNGYMETRALCEQINKQTSTEMMSVVHYTTGCQSGFMCMMFYRRDIHVIEIQTGKPAVRLEDACAPDHFDISKTPYTTLLASNPDPQICPMEGLYNLRGAIGPPYLTTRHKRNHNNKIHGTRTHHHQLDSIESSGRTYLHKRHSTLSFRNTNSNDKSTWHSNTRGLPIRSRRDAFTTTKPFNNQTREFDPNDGKQKILVVDTNRSAGRLDVFQKNDEENELRMRSRRDVPECITNYKAQRQFWLGCTEPNVIDVRPKCNDEGDEEYSCHGSWVENATVFIIARHKGTKHGVCISYRPTEGTAAILVIGDACYRGTQKPPEHHLMANLSIYGKCGETRSASSGITIISWLHLLSISVLLTFSSQLSARCR
ncbi:argus isoform 2-T2 [Glossina fuscipes fuscipes]